MFDVSHISVGSIIKYKNYELLLVRCSDGGLNFRFSDDTFALSQNCYCFPDSVSIESVERWLSHYFCG